MATLGQLAASNMRHLRSLNIGYSQPRRWNIWQGGTTDCSASTARAYNMTGLIAPFPEDLRTWTGTWRALAADRGFTVTAWDGDTADLREGDLLLSEEASGGTGHIAMVTYPGVVSEWWGSETGDTDGADGDQTGQEGREKEIDIHPFTLSGNWTHVLRPPALDADTQGAEPTPTTKGLQTMFGISYTTPWGSTAYILCTETAGADALDDVMAQVYNDILPGGFTHVPAHHADALVHDCWVRHNRIANKIGVEVRDQVAAVISAANANAAKGEK